MFLTSSQNKQQNKLYLVLLFVTACLVGIVTTYYHEMWRDESQAFLLVRDSKNLVELWQNVRYEGHPILWHFLLYITYHLFPSIYTIQVLHLLIGFAVLFLIIFYSPFTFLQKVLLVFSYFFSFEYLVISRNYCVGILLIFLAIVAYQKSRKLILLIALILGVAANSNIYGLIISGWLFVYFLSQSFLLFKLETYRRNKFWGAIIIFFLLLTVAALQIIAPPDRTPKLRIAYKILAKRVDKVSKEISETLFYMPDPLKKENYWGSSIYDSKPFNHEVANVTFQFLPRILALVLIVLLVFRLRKKPPILVFFAGVFISLLLFMYMVFDKGLLRHTGAFFVLFITTLWLYQSDKAYNRKQDKPLNLLFNIMLWIQFCASIIVHLYEFKYTFSGANDAAKFLIKTNRNNSQIIIHPDFEGMSIIHYAGIQSVYYCTIHDRGSFIKFSDRRKRCSNNELAAMALRENIETLIFNGKKDDSLIEKMGFELIYEPQKTATVSDESFFIYGKKSKQ